MLDGNLCAVRGVELAEDHPRAPLPVRLATGEHLEPVVDVFLLDGGEAGLFRGVVAEALRGVLELGQVGGGDLDQVRAASAASSNSNSTAA